MYCPNCGQIKANDQKFCRKCGLKLDSVAQSLMSQLDAGNIPGRDRGLELLGTIAFSGLGIIFLAAVSCVIFLALSRLVYTGDSVLFGIGATLFILFASMGLIYVFVTELRKESPKDAPRAEPWDENTTTAKLIDERPFEPVSSVVEDTTELLNVESRTRKR